MTAEELEAKTKKLEEENAALKANLASSQGENKEFEALQKQIKETEARTQALEIENKKLTLERDKEAVMKEFPHAAKFPEFITGGNKAEMSTQAKALHERLESERKAAAAEKEREIGKVWGDIANSGQSGLMLSEDEKQRKYEEAKKNGNIREMITHKIMNTFKQKTA